MSIFDVSTVAGAFGFVQVATRNSDKTQVAVKVIKKAKVLSECWEPNPGTVVLPHIDGDEYEGVLGRVYGVNTLIVVSRQAAFLARCCCWWSLSIPTLSKSSRCAAVIDRDTLFIISAGVAQPGLLSGATAFDD